MQWPGLPLSPPTGISALGLPLTGEWAESTFSPPTSTSNDSVVTHLPYSLGS